MIARGDIRHVGGGRRAHRRNLHPIVAKGPPPAYAEVGSVAPHIAMGSSAGDDTAHDGSSERSAAYAEHAVQQLGPLRHGPQTEPGFWCLSNAHAVVAHIEGDRAGARRQCDVDARWCPMFHRVGRCLVRNVVQLQRDRGIECVAVAVGGERAGRTGGRDTIGKTPQRFHQPEFDGRRIESACQTADLVHTFQRQVGKFSQRRRGRCGAGLRPPGQPLRHHRDPGKSAAQPIVEIASDTGTSGVFRVQDVALQRLRLQDGAERVNSAATRLFSDERRQRSDDEQ
ncbi:hypothetical protein GEMMAAP_13125 [Gemmatimonas phototrophica]|uniref:Uncharacterized protein n=1 Tax=Gemmatimonas phototrophica TaxID=1379270 RepID=A0A143BLK9_9BACT|nr:hypothetical protein GEMMAAP_13125 [Gemmatimonas phototrophica]